MTAEAEHPTAAVRPGSVRRTFEILEVVAARGGASAKEIAEVTGLPLPTVYRLVRELLDADYLIHIRDEKRFELGYKLHQLGVSLHQQIGVPRQVRAEVSALHEQLRLAAYFAIHRGAQIVVVFTADSPDCPRLGPLDFAFHEAAHATALGKREFQAGATCAAAAVRAANGGLVGSVAVSGPDARFARGREEVEAALRATASRLSRFYRSGRTG